MARPKQLQHPKKFNMHFEEEQFNKLAKRVPNVAEWIRNRVDEFVDIETDLNTLKLRETEISRDIEEQNQELQVIREKIAEIEQIQKDNAENEKLQTEILATINKVITYEFNGKGITKDRLNVINQNRLTTSSLNQLVKSNHINIIKPAEIETSNIVTSTETKKHKHNKTLTEISPIEELLKKFNKDYNKQNNNNAFSSISKKQYLSEKEPAYRSRCANLDINFDDFKALVLSE